MKSKNTGHRREYSTSSFKFLSLTHHSTSAWFDDLGDGVHKGDSNDPRISLIQVVPNEIRYWKINKGKIGSPGELRTITQDEVSVFIELGG